MSSDRAEQDRYIADVIRQRVSERAEEWFGPGVGIAPAVRVRQVDSRPRALLLAVYLDEDSDTPRVMAKIRREPSGASPGQAPRRPVLAAEVLSVSELCALEYDGLRSIHTLVGDADPMFGSVRPLDHLEQEDAILMEYVHAPTLRRRLLAQNRVWSRRPFRAPDPWDPWRRAGAWLRVFQHATPHGARPARQSTREDVLERFDAYSSYLAQRLGTRFADLGTRGSELAAGVLPDQLTLAVAHGDFAPRNVFVGQDDRLTVFDPLPRWLVPAHEDLGRMLVSVRLLGLQVHTHGRAFSEATLQRVEREVIHGYAGERPVQMAELRCYELMVLFDKWSALLDAADRDRSRLRRASLDRATVYVRGQAEAVLDLAAAGR